MLIAQGSKVQRHRFLQAAIAQRIDQLRVRVAGGTKRRDITGLGRADDIPDCPQLVLRTGAAALHVSGQQLNGCVMQILGDPVNPSAPLSAMLRQACARSRWPATASATSRRERLCVSCGRIIPLWRHDAASPSTTWVGKNGPAMPHCLCIVRPVVVDGDRREAQQP
jgi:hypothetical protein